MWRYTTGRYTLPIKIAQPYSNVRCLTCHGESQKFLTSAGHPKEELPGLAANKTSCLDCHGPAHPAAEAGGDPMTPQPTRIRLLRIAIVLVALFAVMALAMLIRDSPIGFTLFMFLGQPLFVIALVLLVGAVLADLRIRGLV